MHTAKPQILMLHGGGTSAAIFFAQTRKIRAALQTRFEFIYVDAPIKSGPGPGVLPYFEDSGPFYRWFSEAAAHDPHRRDIEISDVNDAIAAGLKRQGRKSANIIGVLGFSQGTIVSSLLLWQQSRGDPKWTNLRFGALFCGGGGGDVKTIIHEPLDVPSVHIHGLSDPILPASRALVEAYAPENTVVMEFDGGHHIPTQMRDIEMFAHFLIDASGINRRKSSAKVLEVAFQNNKRRTRPADLLLQGRRPSAQYLETLKSPTGRKASGMHLSLEALRSPTGRRASGMHSSLEPLKSPPGRRASGMHSSLEPLKSPTGRRVSGMHTSLEPLKSPTRLRRGSHHKLSEVSFTQVHVADDAARRRSSARPAGPRRVRSTHLEVPFTDPFSGKTLSPQSGSDSNSHRPKSSTLSVHFEGFTVDEKPEFSFNEKPLVNEHKPIELQFNEQIWI